MKIPETPPSVNSILASLYKEGGIDKMEALIIKSKPTDSKNNYHHWEKAKHLDSSSKFTPQERWVGMKLARRALYKTLGFTDTKNRPFQFATPDEVLRDLHWLDQHTSGSFETPKSKLITDSETRSTYLIKSLINESISSSQLEGATTTRAVAKQMLRQGRNPTDKSEQMIFNNYRAMLHIKENLEHELTPEFILELHRMLTEKTLDIPERAGKLRLESDNIDVLDHETGRILHSPPAVDELPNRLKLLCQFANREEEDNFTHPLIKAIVLHFTFAYDHPFYDGNGRTARALFYWYAVKHGYWVLEFTSISTAISKAKEAYSRAFLHTETDENDLTYFIIHQLDILKKQAVSLFEYLVRKQKEIDSMESSWEQSIGLQKLNARQVLLLKHALRNPKYQYTIKEHEGTHRIVYQTARQDLLTLSERHFLIKRKRGKEFVFEVSDGLRKMLGFYPLD